MSQHAFDLQTRLSRLTLGFVLFTASACAEDVLAPGAMGEGARLASVGVGSEDEIPVRDSDLTGARSWAVESDSTLWLAGQKVGSIFNIGVKAPGKRRGIYRGITLISNEGRLDVSRILQAARGIAIVNRDDRLPLFKVRIDDLAALTAIRRSPYVDYMEPAAVPLGEVLLSGGAGCAYPGRHNPAGAYDSYGDFIPRDIVYL